VVGLSKLINIQKIYKQEKLPVRLHFSRVKKVKKEEEGTDIVADVTKINLKMVGLVFTFEIPHQYR